jgi:MFS family permease
MTPSQYESKATGVYRDTLWWNVSFSAYWFATSYKWFILLFILLPRQAEEIGGAAFKNTTWGWILGSGAILAVILPPVFARITETAGGGWGYRQRWIFGGMLITVVGCLVLTQAGANYVRGVHPSLPLGLLAAGFYLLQLGDQAGTASYAGMVADTVPSERRDYASGILGALRLFGQIASIAVAFVLNALHVGFAGLYIAVAAVNGACALLTLAAIKRLPPLEPHPHARGSFLHDWIEPFHAHDFRYVWLNRFAVALGTAAVLTYAINYLTDMFPRYVLFGLKLGEGKQGAEFCALVLALTMALTGAIGALVASRLSEKRGRKGVLLVAGVFAFCVLVPAAFVRDFNLLWLFICGFGFSTGAYAAADWALVSDILPDKTRSGTHMGVWHAADTVVQVFVGSIGWGIDNLNKLGHGTGYAASIIFGGVLFLLSTVFVRQIRGSR